MNNVTTLKRQRQVGSLTAEDLGTTISIDDEIFTPLMVIHTIDENTGTAFTLIYENTSLLFPYTAEDDALFEVVS